MTQLELQRLMKKYPTIPSKIDDLMSQSDVSHEDGEAILLFLAGISAGARQAAVNGSDWLLPISLGWAFGAERGDG